MVARVYQDGLAKVFVWCVNVCSQKFDYFQGLKLFFVRKVGSGGKFVYSSYQHVFYYVILRYIH